MAKWLSVSEYAKKTGKNRIVLHWQIRNNKFPPEKVRVQEVVKKRIEILYED